MRRRQLKWLWQRLKQLAGMKLAREELLMKLGAARAHAPTAWRLVAVDVAEHRAAFDYRLDRDKLRREKALKEWRRDWKIALIEQSNPEWTDLYPDLAASLPSFQR